MDNYYIYWYHVRKRHLWLQGFYCLFWSVKLQLHKVFMSPSYHLLSSYMTFLYFVEIVLSHSSVPFLSLSSNLSARLLCMFTFGLLPLFVSVISHIVYQCPSFLTFSFTEIGVLCKIWYSRNCVLIMFQENASGTKSPSGNYEVTLHGDENEVPFTVNVSDTLSVSMFSRRAVVDFGTTNFTGRSLTRFLLLVNHFDEEQSVSAYFLTVWFVCYLYCIRASY